MLCAHAMASHFLHLLPGTTQSYDRSFSLLCTVVHCVTYVMHSINMYRADCGSQCWVKDNFKVFKCRILFKMYLKYIFEKVWQMYSRRKMHQSQSINQSCKASKVFLFILKVEHIVIVIINMSQKIEPMCQNLRRGHHRHQFQTASCYSTL